MHLDSIITPRRLNPRHHLLLRNQMINPLQQPQQTLHAPTPLIQHLVRIPRPRKRHHPRWPIDLRIHRLRRHQRTDIRFRLLLVQVKQLRQSVHLDAGVIFRDDADVVLDDALAQVLPTGVGFGVVRVVVGCGGEDVRGAEVGAEA